MSKDDDFIDVFTTECLANGICKPVEICNVALQEIEKIDTELDRITNLRSQRDNYMGVLRSFGHDAAKARGRRNKIPMINPEISESDKDPSFIELLNAVCKEIETSDNPLTSRRLISGVGFEGSDPSPVYVSLKWLLDRGILKRDNDRAFLPGENWENRFQETTKKET